LEEILHLLEQVILAGEKLIPYTGCQERKTDLYLKAPAGLYVIFFG
jgi:hypothetical protein